MSWALYECSFSLSNYVSLLFLLYLLFIYFFSSFSLSYSFFRLLMVKCLLRQVVTWSCLPGPILSSLSKPYKSCVLIHTYILIHIKEATPVSATAYTSANKARHLRAHRKLIIGSHMYKIYVCLSVCSYRWRRCTKTFVSNIKNRQR
jgi:hypothetical protein